MQSLVQILVPFLVQVQVTVGFGGSFGKGLAQV